MGVLVRLLQPSRLSSIHISEWRGSDWLQTELHWTGPNSPPRSTSPEFEGPSSVETATVLVAARRRFVQPPLGDLEAFRDGNRESGQERCPCEPLTRQHSR